MNGYHRIKRLGVVTACAIMAFSQVISAAPRKERDAAPQPWAHAAAVSARVHAALDAAQETGDVAAAEKAITDIFDQVIAFAPATQMDSFVEVAQTLRLVRLVGGAGQSSRADLLAHLRANPNLQRSLVFLVGPGDKPKAVCDALEHLRRARGGHLDAFANLAAAICLVHDQPLKRRINESSTAAPDPIAIFDYFAANERRMAFGVREAPAELLVYVVDTTAGIDEMQWALERYHGDLAIGDRFFEIKYDYDHFLKGRAKKVTEAGYSLPNILQHGGVCADQAYYAMSIGKALGVPTTYTVGRSGEMSHAWVGYLESERNQVWWNFSSGRYESYQGVRGSVIDPKTGSATDDSFVALLADLSMTPVRQRVHAAALTDAAVRLIVLAKAKAPLAASAMGEGDEPLRSADKEAQLALLEQALRQCAGYAPAWLAVRDLAQAGQLALADKRKWAGALDRLCGQRYPDFYLDVLGPMIRTIENPRDQDALWNAAFRSFARRLDLAAEVRLEQGKMWEAHGNPAMAGRCYEDVIDHLVNGGPFALQAIARAEKLLADSRRPQLILALYEKAWNNVNRPGPATAMFFRQSNWYRIGTLYAQRLRQAGMTREAINVENKIESEERNREAR